MLVYLIRHGKTAWNLEGRYQGRSDIPLCEAGKRTLAPADFSPERVYVSPMKRAEETARILFPRAQRISIPGLEEMDFGAFEGKSFRELEDDPAYRAWVEGNCAAPCPGGEGQKDFSQRVCAAFDELMEREREQLVIVAHGGTQMAILEKYGRPRRDYFAWQSPNGGGFLLEAEDWESARELKLLREIKTFGKD